MLLLAILTISIAIVLFLLYRLHVSSQQLIKTKSHANYTESRLLQEVETQKQLIAELKQLKGEVSQNILHDALTGLPSWTVLEDRATQILKQSQRHNLMFALLFLDIDGFKIINTALSHDIGDLLLAQVAERLTTCIRQVDSVCRYTGDKFVFLITQVNKPESAVFVAQRILNEISQPFEVYGQELFITAGIGISVYPNDGEHIPELLKNADNAMQQAKAAGCNNYKFFRSEMEFKSQRALILNTCLRSDEIYDELFVYYQPQVDTTINKIVSVESLLRWQHPDFGLILPRDFIKLAENSGKIVPIGEWVIRTACRQYQNWITQGIYLEYISVNISLKQLENSRFLFRLAQILHESNMDPSCLELEISEEILPDKPDFIEKTFQMLKRIGVRIAVDNFGTGRLSLQNLRHYPVNCLKIDASLIRDIVENKDSQAITQMIITLADSLHLTLLAEGVENLEQKRILSTMGCYLMQGHLFSPPVLANEFSQLVIKTIPEPEA